MNYNCNLIFYTFLFNLSIQLNCVLYLGKRSEAQRKPSLIYSFGKKICCCQKKESNLPWHEHIQCTQQRQVWWGCRWWGWWGRGWRGARDRWRQTCQAGPSEWSTPGCWRETPGLWTSSETWAAPRTPGSQCPPSTPSCCSWSLTADNNDWDQLNINNDKTVFTDKYWKLF